MLPLSFFYQEITDFHYFRYMISLLISKLYFDVILFNQKILIVLDTCFRSSIFILWVLFDNIQSLNRLPYQIKKKYSMLISGFHHQIMSGRVTALEETL